MKYQVLLILILLNSILLNSIVLTAQVAVSNDGSTADSTAILDIISTTKGLLIPRMTTTQRTAIPTTVTSMGLLVYDNTTNGFWFYNGTAWVDINASIFKTLNNVVVPGSAITIATDDFVFGSIQLDDNGNENHESRMFL